MSDAKIRKWFNKLSPSAQRELEIRYAYRADQNSKNKAESALLPNLTYYDKFSADYERRKFGK